MKKYQLFAIFGAVSLFWACGQQQSKPKFEGFWLDSSGMAAFEVRKEGESFILANRMGSLRGTQLDSIVQGVTDLGDTFKLQVRGDSAQYHIMGVEFKYRRINKDLYDSIMGVQ